MQSNKKNSVFSAFEAVNPTSKSFDRGSNHSVDIRNKSTDRVIKHEDGDNPMAEAIAQKYMRAHQDLLEKQRAAASNKQGNGLESY